jgi:hypothetical protein
MDEEYQIMDEDYQLISASKKFKVIIESLDHGTATTKEIVVMTISNVQFEIHFDYHFTYDYSNGLNADKPVLTKIIKSDGNDATEEEIYIIKHFINEYYY